MGGAAIIGLEEGAQVGGAVARLEARGLSRRGAIRRVARRQATSVRHVRKVLAGGEFDSDLRSA